MLKGGWRVRYQRVLIKLSGGALSGSADFGFEPAALEHIADEVLSVAQSGVQVALVIGGGNIFRGNLGEQWGIERAEADNIGMMATVVNSLMLRGVLHSRGAKEVRVMTAFPIEAVAEPYIRLRAIHHLEKGYQVVFAAGIGQPYVTTDYPAVQRALETRCEALLVAKSGVDGIFDADPKHNAAARRYRTLSYADAIRQDLRVMDPAAFILARDHDLPMHVFDFTQVGALRGICQGADVGTTITVDSATVIV